MSWSQHAISLLKNQKYPFIPRIALSFSRIALLFPRSVLLFLKSALLFPRSAYFSKMSYCFPELPFSFHKCLLFIYCALVFPGILFSPADGTFSLSSSELLRDISLAFVLFPLGALYWQTCLLDNLKTSSWSMIFYTFYSNFSLHVSLENAVSKHLEWLKF